MRREMKSIFFSLFFYSVSALAEKCILYQFSIALSGYPDFPAYIETHMLGDVVISHYDSITNKSVPRQECLKKHLDSAFWNNSTIESMTNKEDLTNDLELLNKQHTGENHTLLSIYCCEWDNKSGFTSCTEKSAYDGEDIKAMKGMAQVPGEVPDKIKACLLLAIEYLQYIVLHGKECLDMKVSPEVSVFLNHTSPSSAVCHATGFFPKSFLINITWKRDGEEMLEDVDVRETLLNGDGTFQKRVVLTVSPEKRKKSQYTCEVAHASGVITKTLPEDELSFGSKIGLIIVGSLFAVGAILIAKSLIVRCQGHRNATCVASSNQRPMNPAESGEPLMDQEAPVRRYSE